MLHKATRQSQSYCHSEPSLEGEESLPEPLVAHRDSSVVSLPQNDKIIAFARNPNSNSSPLAGVQNDNKSNPQDKITLQGKLVCHSEGGRSPTEESLLSAKDSLIESLERQLVCHSEHCAETSPELPVTLQVCHSEGAQGATEESLKESLVAHRDSSVITIPSE